MPNTPRAMAKSGCLRSRIASAPRGVHPVSLAVAWAAANPAVTCPIIGGRSLEQLQPSLDAIDLAMPADLRNEISALSRTPPQATDRLEEAEGV